MDTDAQFHDYLTRKRPHQDDNNLTASDGPFVDNHKSPLSTNNQYSQIVDAADIFPPLPKKVYKMPNATQSSVKLNIKPGSLTRTVTTKNPPKDLPETLSPSSNSSASSSKPINNSTQANKDSSAGTNTQNVPKANKVRPPPPIVCYDLDTKAAYVEFKSVLGHSNFDLDGPHGNSTYVRTVQ